MSGGFQTGFEKGGPKLNTGGGGGFATGFGGDQIKANKPPKPKGGGGGFFGGLENFGKHIASDASNAVTSFVPGVEEIGKSAAHDISHPKNLLHLGIGSAELSMGMYHLAGKQFGKSAIGKNVIDPIGKQYAHEYGPLLHGHFSQFAHQFYEHPLGPILDAATIATLGVGGVAKAGEIASDAGLISKESALAKLGEPADLTTQFGKDGERVLVKQSSRNPLIRYRQQLVNKALNRLPSETPVVGSTARATRALSRIGAKEGARLDVLARDHNTAFSKLSKPEQVAYHLIARGARAGTEDAMTPENYGTFLKANEGSPALQKILADPKVSELVKNPSLRLQRAVELGRELDSKLTASKVAGGHLDELQALQSPYRHMRMLSGSEMEPVMSESPLTSAAKDRLEAATKANEDALKKEEEFHKARQKALETLPENHPHRSLPLPENPFRDEVVKTGHALETAQQEAKRLEGNQVQSGAVALRGGKSAEQIIQEIEDAGGEHPFHIPDSAHTPGARNPFARKPSGFSPQEGGMAAKQSRLLLAKHGLIHPYENALGRDYARHTDQIAAQAVQDELVKHAHLIPRDAEIPRGWEEVKLNKGQASAPYMQRVSAELEHSLGQHGLRERVSNMGHLVQPRDASGYFEEPHRMVVPAQVKKILEDESKSSASKLGAIRRIPMNVWKGAVLGLRPAFFGNITVGNSILGTLQMAPGRWGFVGWLHQVLPGFDHAAGYRALSEEDMKDVFPEQVSGTFGGSVTPHGYHGASKILRGASRAAQGVMPATIRYENLLRRAMAEGWSMATPEIRDLVRRNGGDLGSALRQVQHTHPQIIDNITRRIDNALGNYRTYNRVERAIKSVVPFYGWNRHVTSSLFRLASERPQVLDAVLNSGIPGARKAQLLAGFPSYLNEAVPVHLPGYLGGKKGSGIQTVFDARSLNPFSTLTDEGKLLASPFTHAGASSDAFPLAPDLQAAIEQLTGKSLLTGAPIKGNALRDELMNLVPQESLFTRHVKPTSINQNSRYDQLLRVLGLPVENVNKKAARQKWRTLNIPIGG